MSDAPLMLGVSGLRGITGASLTPDVASRFAAALGEWLRSRPGTPPDPIVVVGADGRAGYEPIRDAALAGLFDAGCRVVDLGVAMTPTVGVMVDRLGAAGGLVVTASHNPQEWNGLKCLVRSGAAPGVPDACAPDAGAAGEIIARFHARPASPDRGAGGRAERRDDAAGVHVAAVLDALGPDAVEGIAARRFRVLLDSVNGSGRFGGRELLTRLGCELIHHGADAGGVFPHRPEPTRENLASLCGGVTKFAARVGFAQDPDADRLAIVDDRGTYIGEEYTLALAAESLLGAPPRPSRANVERILVANLSTSRMIDDIAARRGARVARTPVGEANVVADMKRRAHAGGEVLIGGEGNGGVIWPRVTFVRDSLAAMALVLALMARASRSIRELVADLPAYAIEKRKIDLARTEDAARALARLVAEFSPASVPTARPGAVPPSRPRVDLQDGVRVDWDGRLPGGGSGRAWLHVRPSNTEPILRLIAEAPTARDARDILDHAQRLFTPS